MKALTPVLAICLLNVILSPTVSDAEATATIEKFFGSVVFHPGSRPKTITCKVTDVESKGRFEWRLGQQVIRSGEEGDMTEENELEDSLDFQPKIEDDGKTLVCRYIIEDDFGETLSTIESDKLKVVVEVATFPNSPVDAGTFAPGERIDFTIEFEMSPDPTSEDISWQVTGPDSDSVTYKSGEKDSANNYEVGALKTLGNHKFSSTLSILKASEAEAMKTHTFVVKGRDTKKTEHKIEVTFSLFKEDAKDEKASTEEPKSSQMNIGIIIIMVLVILIIVICIGYCIYRKYGRKPEPKEPVAKQNYQPAPTTDPENPATR